MNQFSTTGSNLRPVRDHFLFDTENENLKASHMSNPDSVKLKSPGPLDHRRGAGATDTGSSPKTTGSPDIGGSGDAPDPLMRRKPLDFGENPVSAGLAP